MTSTLIAAAISGIVLGGAAHASTQTASPNAASAQQLADEGGGKHACKGQNACKGQGGCKH